ncbi:MAG: hypothetical protein LBL31_05835 [Spirochaetaceae bacterium]|jgi:hypothetical protein|nr:hypothetical protein [Spirochaetaceae bacterium]
MKRLIVLFGFVLAAAGCGNWAGDGRGTDRSGEETVVPVTGISGALPGKIVAGYEADLNGYITVEPEDATRQTIVWTIKIDGVPAADAADGVFTPAKTGTLHITGKIPGGKAGGGDFELPAYTVTVISVEDYVPVTGISGVPERRFAGVPLDLSTVTVTPEDATYNRIVWSIENAGTTGAAIGKNSALTASSAGTLTLRGAVNGLEGPSVRDFTIEINALPLDWTKAANVPDAMPGEIQTVCYGIVNGQGLFVAGSRENDGRIAWSDDGGATWHGLDSAATTFQDSIDGKVVGNFAHVRFLNGKFWAVGGNGHMAKSEDGKTWTAVASPGIKQNIVDIAYGEVDGYVDGVFVAGGDRGTMSYSTDGGATWTANDQTVYFTAGGSTADFKVITFAAGKFLAAGQFAKTVYSSDGITWTDVSGTIKTDIIRHYNNWPTSSGHLGLSVAAYGAGVYVIGGQGVLGISADLENWERIDMEAFGFPRGRRPGWINSLIYADGLFVLGGGDGNAAYSADGREWIRIGTTNPVFHNFHFINGLAYDGKGGFVAAGATCGNPNSHSSTSLSEYDHLGNVGCVAYITPAGGENP